ncbi:MAG: oxygenase MpaB family protein [Ramlibacter sp.]
MTPAAAQWAAAAREADPLADRTVAAIIGPWSDEPGAMASGIARLGAATRLMAGWTTNAGLASWQPGAAGVDPGVVTALQAYLAEGSRLPSWTRPADVERAEDVFMDYGPMSCVLLFCASLPECYVLPHLSEVLHVAGQLEAHTEHRIRQTAAMVFPVMMKGGLTSGGGGGVAQVLKVRLIHATIRHLILHGTPQLAHGRIAPQPATRGSGNLQQALVSHGWDVERQGPPCSQLELAYTLLTFGYVFLQGMRTLGLPLSRQQEEATLHAWNVAGHVLGIRDELMAHTMDEAAAMFTTLQAMARAQEATPDVRPGLGQALVGTMARSIRLPVIRNLPVPLTRWLVGRETAHEIGLDRHVGLLTRLAFGVARVAVRLVDGMVRVFLPQFSLTRMFTRVVGYHLLTRFLLDQTRPLALPDELLQPMHGTVAGWHHDLRAPDWVNRLEDRLTTHGPWGGER